MTPNEFRDRAAIAIAVKTLEGVVVKDRARDPGEISEAIEKWARYSFVLADALLAERQAQFQRRV